MSEDALLLLSIGDIAKSLGITRRIILNYEDKGLICADIKHGAAGNRYYTVDTLTRIRSIRVLQKFGLSLDEICSYYNGTADMPRLISRLEKLRDELNYNIEQLKERVGSPLDLEIRTSMLPAQTVYCQTIQTTTVADKTRILRNVFSAAFQQYGIDGGKRIMFIEYPIGQPDLVSYCIAVPRGSEGEHIRSVPEEQALCCYHHGSYEAIPAIVAQLLTTAQACNVNLQGICRHIYLEGPPQHQNPDRYITQIALPLLL